MDDEQSERRRAEVRRRSHPSGETGAELSGVKSARRTIELVETVAASNGWMSLSDLHVATGMPRSSLHGLVRTLLEAGWLETDPNGTRYRLGVRALISGTAYLDRDPAVPFATQALEVVRAESGYTSHFARLHGTEVVYLESRESQHSTRLVSRVGRTLPAHATALGKALLAELTADEVEALLPETLAALTPRTVTSRDELQAELAQIRGRGYASEVEEGTPGVRCVAAVIPYRIPGTDALSCSMPVGEATDHDAKRVGELLVRATADLGRRLRSEGIR